MAFKIVSIVIALYALIGASITTMMLIDEPLSFDIEELMVLILYCILPSYAAYGIWRRQNKALIVMIAAMCLQSFRSAGNGLLPDIAPITLSIYFNPNHSTSGFLVDFFAIAMVGIFLYLNRLNSRITNNSH